MKKNIEILSKKRKELNTGITGLLIILVAILCGYSSIVMAGGNKLAFASVATASSEEKEYVYLSDLEYITANNWSYNGWAGHTIQKDKNPEGGEIKLKVDGQIRTYLKGLGVHAKGQVTYNIENLSNKYTRFTAKIGLDASRTVSSNIHFQILVSKDGENWTLLQRTDNIKPGQEAINVDLDIADQKYLRIYVDPNGVNTSDHGVIANAKLTIEGYEEAPFVDYDNLKELSYYDNILAAPNYDYNSDTAHRLIMEREFVRKIGYEKINLLANFDEKNRETLDWIAANTRVLEECVEVGNISDGTKFLNILTNLYQTYKEELKAENGDVYEKMMIGLAAGYSTDKISSPLTFSHLVATYDYMARFAAVKELYDSGAMIYSNGWKTFHIEFFRYLMHDGPRPDEIKWMNYIGRAKNYSTGVYTYVPYIKPNYSMSAKPHLYDAANKDKYEKKWHLEENGVPFADATTRYWMVMEEGGICWNQARTTKSVIINMGRPSISVYQVDHESALYYISENPDGTGKGTWNLAGNIYGWGKSCNAWYGGNRTRTVFGWSSKSFTSAITNAKGSGDSAGYIYLAQANLNNYDAYKASLYLNLYANSFTNNEDKLRFYNEALEVNHLNLDSYDYKIQMYKALNKTSEEWHSLAEDIINNYTFYPMAMGDLINLIKPYLNGVDRVDIDQKYYDALLRAKVATVEDIWQKDACQSIANARLGSANNQLATFSFDGDNDNKIVLSDSYDTFTDLMWKYSLDGGVTKSEGTLAHALELSQEEIAKINSADDIQIYIVGLTESKPTYTIDIVEGTLPNNLYANDLENRVIGVNLTMEWRQSENDSWTKYADASPNNTGNKTLYVRVGATRNALPSNSITYTFTEDNQPDTRKYIKVAQLSIESYSTQSKDNGRPFYAPNAIDGNKNTMWHTDFSQNVLQQQIKPFITIKLDDPKYISAVEFIQTKYKVNDPDDIKNMKVYVSEDNKNWTLAGKIENCPKDGRLKVIDFEQSVYGKYVKLEMDTYNMFASLAMVNIYKDITKQEVVVPTAAVGYNIETITNTDVLARIVGESEPITITNNDGSDTYIFTKNGTFTFEFVNASGVKGTATAKVDWIDKDAPTATIEYSTVNKTNKSVIATLKPSEDVIVTNNGDFRVDYDGNVLDRDGNIIEGYTIDGDGNIKDSNGNIITNINTFTYEFYDNAEFTFEFMDKAGNSGSTTAKVDWIDYEAPIGTLHYDITGTTNKDVKVNIEFNEETIVTNNKGSTSYTFSENGEFTFEFKDIAGNTNKLVAKVNWIDKDAPTAELKYEKFDDKVIVTVINPSEQITFAEGTGIYEFTSNGNYDILFYDKAGNVGKLTAVIDSLNVDNPDDGNDNNNGNDNNGNLGNNNNNNNNQGNNGSNNNNSNNDNNNQNEPINNDYTKFSSNKVVVEIPTKDIKEEATLKTEEFTLADELKNQFGDASEYYNIYLENSAASILNVNVTSPIKIKIRLNEMKEFIGVYEIADNNVIKPADYVKNGNYIEISTKTLGKYVVSYKEIKSVSPTITDPITTNKEQKGNNLVWIIGGIGVVILGAFIYFFKIK